MSDLLAVMLDTSEFSVFRPCFWCSWHFEIHASHWLNIPSKCCVVPWYTTATSVVGTIPLKSRCGRYLNGRYHRYTMVFCTMCRTLISSQSSSVVNIPFTFLCSFETCSGFSFHWSIANRTSCIYHHYTSSSLLLQAPCMRYQRTR